MILADPQIMTNAKTAPSRWSKWSAGNAEFFSDRLDKVDPTVTRFNIKCKGFLARSVTKVETLTILFGEIFVTNNAIHEFVT